VQAVKEEIELTPSPSPSAHRCSGRSPASVLTNGWVHLAGITSQLDCTRKEREVKEPYLPPHLPPYKNTQCPVSPRSTQGPHRLYGFSWPGCPSPPPGARRSCSCSWGELSVKVPAPSVGPSLLSGPQQ